MGKIRVRKPKTNKLSIYADARVSLKARGLYSTIRALMESRSYSIERVFEAVPEDPDTVYKIIMELRTLGYVQRVTIDGVTEFRFRNTPLRKASRVKNKSPLIYSKSMAQVTPDAAKQIRKGENGASEFDGWDDLDSGSVQPEVFQPSFLSPPRVAKDFRSNVVPKSSHHLLQRLCFLVETEAEALTLTSGARGRIAGALGNLANAGADLSQLNRFEDWWNTQWRSKDKQGSYQPPTPEQVVEYWFIAMKAETYKPVKLVPAEPKHLDIDLVEVMKNRAKSRYE